MTGWLVLVVGILRYLQKTELAFEVMSMKITIRQENNFAMKQTPLKINETHA